MKTAASLLRPLNAIIVATAAGSQRFSTSAAAPCAQSTNQIGAGAGIRPMPMGRQVARWPRKRGCYMVKFSKMAGDLLKIGQFH